MYINRPRVVLGFCPSQRPSLPTEMGFLFSVYGATNMTSSPSSIAPSMNCHEQIRKPDQIAMLDPSDASGPPEPDEPSDLEYPEDTQADDDRWDVFIPDDDECDPLPDPDDFWISDVN
jgi:hypothetical protein